MQTNTEKIALERDSAVRVIKYLQNRPFIEVFESIEQIRTLEITQEKLVDTLNYLLKDENVWAFAYLHKALSTAQAKTPLASPAPQTREKTPAINTQKSQVENLDDNIA